ncbi:hypothetical protein IHQ71_17745 [Rhizobium sp. TH2]|uniref:hypothetical protein n=1 Tax=Rhizobium sp. TH2 TaxID=2775403 RepID=UPI00215720BB|nr:hypothetical protein [Rhizobium sp. TH2]UVC07066.1 hypothetical protein IHQ71_17745 [Rhizobium sp. TH2]
MQVLVGLWYYLLAGMCFVLFGAVAHVSRAVFNVYPDRLSDKPLMDMAISDGYDADDWVFGTEYDEAGYYKLDSGRNLKIAVLSLLVLGWGAMLLSTEIALAFAHAADAVFAWVGELFVRRLGEARW